MNTIIFVVGFIIFSVYMFFLIRMINIAHKQQEREQGNLNYKSEKRFKKELSNPDGFPSKVKIEKIKEKK